jgi:hypothetical protein
VSLTLQSEFTGKSATITQADVNAFVDFLSHEGLEAFFWRLRSFEEHALRGNEFAIGRHEKRHSRHGRCGRTRRPALGATETQLYMKYRQLWRDPDVAAILKRGDVDQVMRQIRLAEDWPR